MNIKDLRKINELMEHWSVKSYLADADVSVSETETHIEITMRVPKETKEATD